VFAKEKLDSSLFVVIGLILVDVYFVSVDIFLLVLFSIEFSIVIFIFIVIIVILVYVVIQVCCFVFIMLITFAFIILFIIVFFVVLISEITFSICLFLPYSICMGISVDVVFVHFSFEFIDVPEYAAHVLLELILHLILLVLAIKVTIQMGIIVPLWVFFNWKYLVEFLVEFVHKRELVVSIAELRSKQVLRIGIDPLSALVLVSLLPLKFLLELFFFG